MGGGLGDQKVRSFATSTGKETNKQKFNIDTELSLSSPYILSFQTYIEFVSCLFQETGYLRQDADIHCQFF